MARDTLFHPTQGHAGTRPFFITTADTLATAPTAAAFASFLNWLPNQDQQPRASAITTLTPVTQPDAATPAGSFALGGAPTSASAIATAPVTQADYAAPAGSFALGGALPSDLQSSAGTGMLGGVKTGDQVDEAMRADIARSDYGVTGAGIKIGILSDSFNLEGGMATDEANGNLPAGVQILEEGASGNDEGRAMADIVHSIAPGAQILFHTATSGEADFASGIAALVAAGCNVIVDDVAYLNEPFFQDGDVVTQAVENAVASGVSYFTAASNEGNDFVQQNFQAMQVILPGLPKGAIVQNFGSEAAPQPWVNIVVPTGGTLHLDMQWDQPFASIGTGHASDDSLGLALYSTSGQLLASGMVDDTGADPVQTLTFNNTTGATAFRLVVYANGGTTPPDMFKIINYGNGNISGGNVGEGSGTVIGHEMVTGANTVGAMSWGSSPAFGGGNTSESFSSVGTGNILYDSSGNLLTTPESPDKVNFLGADGDVTSTFAPFYGTSAAAPAVAAVAALMLQADPTLTPARVTTLLDQSAEPAGGAAYSTGAGLVQADAAVKLALGLHS
jgi:subtilisin family serine protease